MLKHKTSDFRGTLSFCLFFIHLNAVSAYSSYEKKDHSLLLPNHIAGWSFYGNTTIEPSYVRLTQDVKSQTGGLHSTIPVVYRDWEVHLNFHVHSDGKSLVGDGFAFWYTESPASFGTAFGGHEKFRGLGVFFDTYANENGPHSHDHPYISAMINDGTKAYDHDRDGTHTELAGCSSDFRNKEGSIATIRYVRNQLTVMLSYPGTDKAVTCFSVDEVQLPTGYYFGVSAATGDLSDTHDVVSIRAYEVDTERPPEESLADASLIEPFAGHAAPERARVADPPQSSRLGRIVWSGLSYLFVVGVILGCVYLGYKYYLRRQRQRKRLY